VRIMEQSNAMPDVIVTVVVEICGHNLGVLLGLYLARLYYPFRLLVSVREAK
jgi:hypothetical protein